MASLHPSARPEIPLEPSESGHCPHPYPHCLRLRGAVLSGESGKAHSDAVGLQAANFCTERPTEGKPWTQAPRCPGSPQVLGKSPLSVGPEGGPKGRKKIPEVGGVGRQGGGWRRQLGPTRLRLHVSTSLIHAPNQRKWWSHGPD